MASYVMTKASRIELRDYLTGLMKTWGIDPNSIQEMDDRIDDHLMGWEPDLIDPEEDPNVQT